MIRGLVADGATLWLTTQYLDEADALADRIAVIDHGRLNRSRHAAGAEDRHRLAAARGDAGCASQWRGRGDRVARQRSVQVSDGGRRLRAPVESEPGLATRVLRALDEAGALVDDIAVHRPSAR